MLTTKGTMYCKLWQRCH